MSAPLALQWYEEGVSPSDPTVVCGTCAMSQKTVQNAGHAFWDKFEFPHCPGATQQSSSSDAQEEERNDDREARVREDKFADKYAEKRAKREREQKANDGNLLKISEDLKGKDLYELLQIEAMATSEDIKKAYRKLALTYHPDKMTNATEKQKQHFVLIQEAFDIISDPVKRRRYESNLKFDDSTPSDLRKGYADNFFEVFGPVFKRNARWSSKPRVPELGDAETPIEEVKRFYDFWRDFDSWRDPLAMAEQDEVELQNLEEAECREEKRWMERENAKIARKIKQGERERIADLVKISDKHDPRMIAHRAQVVADKEAEKARKAAVEEAEKNRRDAEAREIAEAAQAAASQEEERRQAEKKAKEETKGALKAARQRVRNLHKNAKPVVRRAVHVDQLQEICLRLGTEDLCKLASELENTLTKEEREDSDYCETVELLHREIKKYGATPIEDDTVQLKPDVDSASTATPDSCSEEQSPGHEIESSPATPAKEKRAKEPTPEEIEAERVLAEAQEAEERVRREKKAEEQRKKREQKKREDEKKDAAQRRAEAAQRAKERKAAAKDSEKVEKVVQNSAVPKKANNTGIHKNVILVVTEEGVVFASPESSDEISTISAGSFLVAAGPPIDVDGYDMVPLQPCGSVELRIVKKMANAEVDVVVDAVDTPEPAAPVAAVPEAAVPAPAKTANKAAKVQIEEDLDGLLSEFGVVLQTATKSPKKKGKK